VQTVNDLAGSRFDWEQALRDISRTLPADVTLSQLNGTLSSTAGTGGGASSLRGAIDVPAIDLQGCTGGQTDVATLMSRVRDVDGVTRVSLSKTDKEAPTTRSVPQGAVTSGATDVNACGRGDGKPSFDVIAFFENDASAANDPAGLSTPGSPTPAAAAATAAASASASPTPAPGQSTPTSATQGQSK
jgi:hypothetical protein